MSFDLTSKTASSVANKALFPGGSVVQFLTQLDANYGSDSAGGSSASIGSSGGRAHFVSHAPDAVSHGETKALGVHLDTAPGQHHLLDITDLAAGSSAHGNVVECLERGPIAVGTGRDTVHEAFTGLQESLRGWWDASDVDGRGGLDVPHGAPVERWVDLSCAPPDPACRDLANPGGAHSRNAPRLIKRTHPRALEERSSFTPAALGRVGYAQASTALGDARGAHEDALLNGAAEKARTPLDTHGPQAPGSERALLFFDGLNRGDFLATQVTE